MVLAHFTTATTFAVGLLGLALHRKHLVSALLCLEALLLTLFVSIALTSQTTANPNTTMQPIILLTLAACEAGTGLSLLVATARTHASNHMKNLNLLTC
uniref:NADH-ubiquinone oxidoreductase chain 4L n=1 Tax=Cyrtodactylus auribalteatus TaxID=2002801 RepID=A0A3G9DN40_9SAUR|nr:NADH dehydrogenase subunit 4L [Cyrtodactylus auribalteatus]